MAESRGPYNRIIDVLNLFAAHPTESLTLSEIMERLSISHGSAHRILKALTEARYLSRHPKHKTYSLGLAVVAVGQAALERHPAVQVARRELADLAGELGVQCLATGIVDDELLVLVKEGTSRTQAGLTRVGERRPFIPPLGLAFLAWARPEVLADYLAKAVGTDTDPIHDHIGESLKVIRERGYSVAASGPMLMRLRQIVSEHVDNQPNPSYWSQMQTLTSQLSRDEIQLLSLAQVESRQLGYISAPVFSPAGDVILELSVTGIHDTLKEAEAIRYAERLCAAAAVVTSETHGRAPHARR